MAAVHLAHAAGGNLMLGFVSAAFATILAVGAGLTLAGPFLLKLYADGGCQGPQFQGALTDVARQRNVEIVKRSNTAKALPCCQGSGSSSGQ